MCVPSPYISVPSPLKDNTSTPGAATSTWVPQFENDALLSSESVAATAMTLSILAGVAFLTSILLFPADAIETHPFEYA